MHPRGQVAPYSIDSQICQGKNMRLQMRFSIIKLYKKIDNLKLMWRKQMLLKHRYKAQYQKLLVDYKQLLVENNELKRGNRNSW